MMRPRSLISGSGLAFVAFARQPLGPGRWSGNLAGELVAPANGNRYPGQYGDLLWET
jgi:hypothetical protein